MLQCQGTFLVISHDRFFVEQIANTIWFIEDYQLKEYPGTYEEYEYWLEERAKNATPLPVSPEKKAKPVEKQAEPKKENTSGNHLVKKEIEFVEQLINELEIKKEDLEKEMALPSVYGDFNKLQTTQTAYDKVKSDLDAATKKWEDLIEKIG